MLLESHIWLFCVSSSRRQSSSCCWSTHLFCLRSSRRMWLNSGLSVGSSAQQRCISWPSSGLWLCGSMVGLRQGHSPKTTRSTISAEGGQGQNSIKKYGHSSQNKRIQAMVVKLWGEKQPNWTKEETLLDERNKKILIIDQSECRQK